jgi:PAS domain S-box-containing protein
MGGKPCGRRLLHRLGLAGPVNLETWRIWFARALIVIGATLFPVGIAFSIPHYISEGHHWLGIIDLLIWGILLIRAFSTRDDYKTNFLVILALLYFMMGSQLISLGPDHARPLWLVVIAVIATFMFGIRGTIVTTVLNVVMLLALYEFMGPENKEWAAEYQASYYEWLVFLMDATLLTLMASLPIGYLLDRIDRSLKQEQEAKHQLLKEGERLKESNEALEREIELRRSTEKTLREKEAYMRVLFEKAPDAYHLFDAEGRIVDINQAAEEMLGFHKEELAGKGFHDTGVVPVEQTQDAFSKFKMHLEGKITDPVEQVLQRKDGSIVTVEVNAYPMMIHGKIHLLAIARDVTMRKRADEERKHMELRFMQSQKMEALGTLAGGIAHDFNNILSAVIGYTELALGSIDKETQLGHQLNGVLSAGARARDLVRQILTFSRRETQQELRPVNVKVVARDVLKLIRATLPATIDIRQHLKSDASVLAESVQIHQLLMNLCTNSGQAMTGRAGVLEVRVSDVAPDAVLLEKYPEMNPCPHVEIVVTDTGRGIPPEAIERIFDPYFTTKASGEGSGLGLAIVHGIVRKSNGVLSVQSRPDHGTTFEIYLPAIEAEVSVDSEQAAPLPTGTERILLVDDEYDIVEVGAVLLEKLGYHVDTSTSSAKALDLFEKDSGKYDLVMTDMTMPGMTGRALAEKMVAIRPDIPIVLCSGLSRQIDRGDEIKMGIKAFVMKPLKLREIALTIRKVLDKAPSGKPFSGPAN